MACRVRCYLLFGFGFGSCFLLFAGCFLLFALTYITLYIWRGMFDPRLYVGVWLVGWLVSICTHWYKKGGGEGWLGVRTWLAWLYKLDGSVSEWACGWIWDVLDFLLCLLWSGFCLFVSFLRGKGGGGRGVLWQAWPTYHSLSFAWRACCSIEFQFVVSRAEWLFCMYRQSVESGQFQIPLCMVCGS